MSTIHWRQVLKLYFLEVELQAMNLLRRRGGCARGRGRRSRGLRRCACPRGARSHSGDNGATVEYRVSGVCLGERAVGATVRARVPLPFSVFEHPAPPSFLTVDVVHSRSDVHHASRVHHALWVGMCH